MSSLEECCCKDPESYIYCKPLGLPEFHARAWWLWRAGSLACPSLLIPPLALSWSLTCMKVSAAYTTSHPAFPENSRSLDTPGCTDTYPMRGSVFRNEPGEAAGARLGGRLGRCGQRIPLPLHLGHGLEGSCGLWKGTGSGRAHPSGPIDSRSDDSKVPKCLLPPCICVVYVMHTLLVIKGLFGRVTNSRISLS